MPRGTDETASRREKSKTRSSLPHNQHDCMIVLSSDANETFYSQLRLIHALPYTAGLRSLVFSNLWGTACRGKVARAGFSTAADSNIGEREVGATIATAKNIVVIGIWCGCSRHIVEGDPWDGDAVCWVTLLFLSARSRRRKGVRGTTEDKMISKSAACLQWHLHWGNLAEHQYHSQKSRKERCSYIQCSRLFQWYRHWTWFCIHSESSRPWSLRRWFLRRRCCSCLQLNQCSIRCSRSVYAPIQSHLKLLLTVHQSRSFQSR